jgi:hypothetical protein
MNNRPIVLAVVGALLCVGAWWFTHTYGFNRVRVWVGPSGEARVNAFYAARLLLEQLGFKVHEQADFNKLDALPPGATVLLAAERSEMDPATAKGLLAWVKSKGGHLIIGAERQGQRDILLAQLNVEARWNATKPEGAARASRIELPDGEAFRVDLLPSPMLIDREDDSGAWKIEAHGSVRLLQFLWGDGLVTVFSTLRPFTNPQIGRLDHAELLAYATRAYTQPGELFLVRHLRPPSLFVWLSQHAPATLVALAGFLVVWLWRVMPRFGPLAPPAEPDRKSLLEHIRAMGRFYADERQLPRQLTMLKENCVALFQRAAPQAQGLDDAGRLREAARLTGQRPRDLAHAFSARADTPHDFSTAVRTLASFRQRLQRRQTGNDSNAQ